MVDDKIPPIGQRNWERWTPDVMNELSKVWGTDAWIVPFVGDRLPPLQTGWMVLDVGCGTGRFSRLFPPSVYTGIDSSAASVEAARKNAPNYTFKDGDLFHLDFGNDQFEIVLNNAVLHHIPAPPFDPHDSTPDALAELWRVTRKYLCTSFIVGPKNECAPQWKGFLSNMMTKERMMEHIMRLNPLPYAIHLHYVDMWAHGTVVVLEKEKPEGIPDYNGIRWG